MAHDKHVKVRRLGKKRFSFLGENGSLWGIRVRAILLTKQEAERYCKEINMSHPGQYETKIVPAWLAREQKE